MFISTFLLFLSIKSIFTVVPTYYRISGIHISPFLSNIVREYVFQIRSVSRFSQITPWNLNRQSFRKICFSRERNLSNTWKHVRLLSRIFLILRARVHGHRLGDHGSLNCTRIKCSSLYLEPLFLCVRGCRRGTCIINNIGSLDLKSSLLGTPSLLQLDPSLLTKLYPFRPSLLLRSSSSLAESRIIFQIQFDNLLHRDAPARRIFLSTSPTSAITHALTRVVR